ncbi:MAG: chemotaxis protein [Bacteroidota bacterium]|nr:chemotaxis protein [Chlorobiota bacterium]MDW8075429.1 chemotaxis protein [Bacteroidota bacterium]
MSELLRIIDARTKLAGTNKVEILLFRLGTDPTSGANELFGINVFKVREIMVRPQLHHPPHRQPGVEGIFSLRGTLIPVINLPAYCGLQTQEPPNVLIVTEYNNHTQGFLVESVETILRCDWTQVRTPPPAFGSSAQRGLITAVVQTDDYGLVLLLDVEKILLETVAPPHDDHAYTAVEPISSAYPLHVVYCDDSLVARKQIERTLQHLGANGTGFTNGKDAWVYLKKCVGTALEQNVPISRLITAVLSDIEMPEMDGFALTRAIKSDPNLQAIPVIIHSSLSGAANEQLAKSVGADGYVSKFEPFRLADTLRAVIANTTDNVHASSTA